MAAANIDEHLGFQHEIKVELDIPAPRLNNRAPHGRINTTEREACERRCDFEDIECGLTEEGARTEASRCLRCDHYGYGIFRGGRNEQMVTLTIDGRTVSVPEGTTILEAAQTLRISIPTLCYLKDINEIGACRICMVEVEGYARLVPSCDSAVSEGMVVYTSSPRVREARRVNLRLLLSQHETKCTKCTRSGNCKLQQLTNDYNLLGDHYIDDLKNIPTDYSNPVVRIENRCVKCMRCIQVCEKIQGMGIWDLMGTGTRTTVGVAHTRTLGESGLHLLRPVHHPLSRGRSAGARRHRQGVRRAGEQGPDHRGAGRTGGAGGLGRVLSSGPQVRHGGAHGDGAKDHGLRLCIRHRLRRRPDHHGGGQ